VIRAARGSWPGCGRAHVANGHSFLPPIANARSLRRAATANAASSRSPGWPSKSGSYKEGPKASKADHQRLLVVLSAWLNIGAVNIVPLLYSPPVHSAGPFRAAKGGDLPLVPELLVCAFEIPIAPRHIPDGPSLPRWGRFLSARGRLIYALDSVLLGAKIRFLGNKANRRCVYSDLSCSRFMTFEMFANRPAQSRAFV
jgi:hypothetical protein